VNGVIVDTSVWIAFFRGLPEDKATSDALDYLLSGDEAIVNEVILTELVPFLNVRGETERAASLFALLSPDLDTDWHELRMLQETCLRAGINKVGIPDLMIAQQAMRLNMPLFSIDKHFPLIAKVSSLCLWPN
jgi:predicted nucleic acid-binding protein